MVKPLTIMLLQKALAEVQPQGYKQCNDRILNVLDLARNVIYPAKGRTPQQMNDIALAYQEATQQIAQTSLGRDISDEKDGYVYLAMLGATIPIDGLKYLLESTLTRLEQETASQSETLEPAQ